MERRSAQKLHSSAIALLQIFDLFFAGSLVTTIFVTSHTYRIYRELLVIHNSVALKKKLGFDIVEAMGGI